MLSLPAEPAVEDGVGGQHCLAGLEHALEHGVGKHDLLVVAAAVLHRLGNQLAQVVDEEDDAVVRGEQLEADREDLVQEALLVALEPHLPVELVGDAQLLVVLAKRGGVLQLLGGTELGLLDGGLVELGQEGRGRLRRGEHRDARAAAAGEHVAGVEHQPAVAQRDLVAVLEAQLADPAAVHVRAVGAAEVLEQEAVAPPSRSPRAPSTPRGRRGGGCSPDAGRAWCADRAGNSLSFPSRSRPVRYGPRGLVRTDGTWLEERDSPHPGHRGGLGWASGVRQRGQALGIGPSADVTSLSPVRIKQRPEDFSVRESYRFDPSRTAGTGST
jgi:hypothetical protein